MNYLRRIYLTIKAKNSQNGQILLLVVLALVVALTVGLSVASRIVTELKISKQNEESQRAFQAAEAGIQQTLKQGTDIPVTSFTNNNSTFKTTINTQSNQATILVNNGQEVDQSTGADVWLSKYDPNPASSFTSPMIGTAQIYWSTAGQSDCSAGSGDSAAPALEVVILEGPRSSPTLRRYLFDQCGSRTSGAAMPADLLPNPPILGTQFEHNAEIQYSNGLVMKVIPVYNSTVVALKIISGAPPSNVFPSQGAIVESTGTSGDTERKVRYYKSLPQLPIEVFPYSILSQ